MAIGTEKMTGMKVKISIVESIETGTPYVLGGQRNGTLNRSANSIDATSKDTEGNWTETIQGFKSWSVDCEGAVIESNTAYKMLEDKFLAGDLVGVIIDFPSGTTYKGMAAITDFPISLPYDDLVTYSISLQGNGQLQKVVEA